MCAFAAVYALYAYGGGTGAIVLNDVDCSGEEDRLEECTESREITNCVHNEDAAVICNSGMSTLQYYILFLSPATCSGPAELLFRPINLGSLLLCSHRNMSLSLQCFLPRGGRGGRGAAPPFIELFPLMLLLDV